MAEHSHFVAVVHEVLPVFEVFLPVETSAFLFENAASVVRSVESGFAGASLEKIDIFRKRGIYIRSTIYSDQLSIFIYLQDSYLLTGHADAGRAEILRVLTVFLAGGALDIGRVFA